ncbi:hypothetical protein Tco_0690409 [Tanacetum coccineum]
MQRHEVMMFVGGASGGFVTGVGDVNGNGGSELGMWFFVRMWDGSSAAAAAVGGGVEMRDEGGVVSMFEIIRVNKFVNEHVLTPKVIRWRLRDGGGGDGVRWLWVEAEKTKRTLWPGKTKRTLVLAVKPHAPLAVVWVVDGRCGWWCGDDGMATVEERGVVAAVEGGDEVVDVVGGWPESGRKNRRRQKNEKGGRRVIMPPRRFKKKSVKRLVEKRVAKAIEEYEKTRADSNNAGGSGSTNTGGTVAPDVQGCSYKTFMNGKPHSFNGTEGVVGLKRWFEKMEQVFEICKCAEDDKVKFAVCTFEGRALTWWNGNVQTLGLANANQIP